MRVKLVSTILTVRFFKKFLNQYRLLMMIFIIFFFLNQMWGFALPVKNLLEISSLFIWPSEILLNSKGGIITRYSFAYLLILL